MLSYRHAFHAGNFADVLKHVVLIEILEHLAKKEAAFEYIDGHAGAGFYDLRSAQAAKLNEYRHGIGRLKPADWPELRSYFSIIESLNAPGELRFYPGSPRIALHLMRPQDRAWLYELHPADHEMLLTATARFRHVKVLKEDSYKGILPLLPPKSRRGLILLDPSYEVKTEVDQVAQTVAAAWQRFPGGIYAIWYPVVDRKRVDDLEKKLVNKGIRDIQRFELGVKEDGKDKGLTAAGMIVINPPFTLMAKMSKLLPRLSAALATDGQPRSRADVLVGE